jgi:hypothetical protein
MRIDQNGRRTDVEYVVRYDGKEVPVLRSAGDRLDLRPSGETITLREIDACTAEGTARENGRIIYQFRRMLASDGKHLIIATTDFLIDGEPTRTVLVYNRAPSPARYSL